MKKPGASALPSDRYTLPAYLGPGQESRAVSLNEIIENSRSIYKRLCGPKVFLEVNLQPNLDQTLDDVVDLNQLLSNLLLLAANAMPFGGFLILWTSNVKCSEELLGQGQYVRVLIEIQRSAPDGTQPIRTLGKGKMQSLRALVRAKVAECQGWFVECQETECRSLLEVLLPSVSLSSAESWAAA